MMLNQVRGGLGLTVTTLFEMVHNSKPDSNKWFELFSIGYLNHDTDNAKSCSKLQAHTLYGIAVGRDDRSNSIIFYNPITSSYYRPPDFRIDESILPNHQLSKFSVRHVPYGGDSCVSDDMDSLSECSVDGDAAYFRIGDTLIGIFLMAP